MTGKATKIFIIIDSVIIGIMLIAATASYIAANLFSASTAITGPMGNLSVARSVQVCNTYAGSLGSVGLTKSLCAQAQDAMDLVTAGHIIAIACVVIGVLAIIAGAVVLMMRKL
jgi:hypothetical protein